MRFTPRESILAWRFPLAVHSPQPSLASDLLYFMDEEEKEGREEEIQQWKVVTVDMRT